MSWSDLGMPDPDDPSNASDGPAEPRPEKPAKEPRPPREPKPPKPAREPRPPQPAPEPKPPREPRPPKPPREPRESGGGGPRTPLILGIIAGILFVAVAVTLAIAFTRGGGGPAPATSAPPATTTPSTAPQPTPSASETAVTAPVALEFAGTGFSLVDESGDETFEYAWADDAADAVEALTDAFGAAPTTRVEPGDGSHYPDYTVYQWDGFMFFDMVETAGGTPRAEYAQPSYVLFSRNEVGGIEMVAERGLSIGMTVDAVRALGPDEEIPRGNVGAIRFVFDSERSNAAGAPQYSEFADTDGSVVTAVLYFRYSAL